MSTRIFSIKDGDWNSVRTAIQRLASQKLGTDTIPLFKNIFLDDITQGSVLFAGASGEISQDNTNLFWDDTANDLTTSGLIVTNAADLGSNSVVFQPTTDSTTFLQVLDADGGTPVLNVDSTNERVGIGTDAPGAQLQITANDNATSVGQLKIISDESNVASEIEIEYESGRGGYNGYLTSTGSVALLRSNHASGGGSMRLTASGSGPAIAFGMVDDPDVYGEYGTFGSALAFWGYARPVQFKAGTNGGKMYTILQGDNSTGFVGLAGEEEPETAIEITNNAPYLTLHNDTHEDTDGGRESHIIAKGEQSGGEETTLVKQVMSHDGAADDQKGKWELYTNDGSDGDSPTLAVTVDSAQALILAGNIELGHATDTTVARKSAGIIEVEGEEVAFVDRHYASMDAYESGNTETVGQTDQYYAIQGEHTQGEVDGWTMVAGSSGAGNITTADGGAAININDTAHGLVSGDYVNVQSANHSGTSVVTYVDDDNFTVAIAYVGDEACTWQEGDYLLAGANEAGKYLLNFGLTCSAGAASKNYKFEAVQNATHLDNSAFEITTQGTNHQSGSGACIITVAASDRIWVQFKNETDAQDLNYEHSHLVLTRL